MHKYISPLPLTHPRICICWSSFQPWLMITYTPLPHSVTHAHTHTHTHTLVHIYTHYHHNHHHIMQVAMCTHMHLCTPVRLVGIEKNTIGASYRWCPPWIQVKYLASWSLEKTHQHMLQRVKNTYIHACIYTYKRIQFKVQFSQIGETS